MTKVVPEAVTVVNTIRELQNYSRKGYFIRWSRGPKYDLKYPFSRDWGTGEIHAGLSAVELNPDWTSTKLAMRIKEYSFARINDLTSAAKAPTTAWIYKGRIVGRDSDGYPVIAQAVAIARLSNSFIEELDRGLAESMELAEYIEDIKSRLPKITDRYAREILEGELIKKENELTKTIRRML